MRNTPKLLTVSFVLLISFSTLAQTYSGFSDACIVLKSDTTTKSVLISNLLEDRVGDISPIIGAAAWAEKNKKLQCRSLLYFEYGMLPMFIKPEQITEAKLILRPLEMNTVESAAGIQASEFIVRRIVEPWEDTLTSWLTQPASNTEDEKIKFLSENKKGKTVRIDVTEIVQNMFRYGNNGFMISFKDSMETSVFLSQWFASARYENKKLRPELLINYSLPVYDHFSIGVLPVAFGFPPPRSVLGMLQQNPMQQPVITNPPPQQTTTQPPIKVPTSNEPQSPPKVPVKTVEN